MRPARARQLAEECRMSAGTLIAITIAAAIAAPCVCYSLGPGLVFLACIVVAAVCAIGFVHETIEARRYDRIADAGCHKTFECHGHE
jgi:hypothetical protein